MKNKITPLMQQYFDIKQQYDGVMLLFQVGDFYELFFEDAKEASSFLGIALTKRGKHNGDPVPLCGVPVHALDHYLSKLVKGGYKVGVCEQLEEAVAGKVVRRGVTRVLTPGTLTDTKLLDEKSASYLLAFFKVKDQWALISAELLTGQLYATVLGHNDYQSLDSELSRFFPDEIIVSNDRDNISFQSYFKKRGYFTTPVIHTDDASSVRGWMARHFSRSMVSRVCDSHVLSNAMQMIYTYLSKTQQQALEHFKTVHFYKPEDFLILDPATQRNLELIQNSQNGGRINTLCAHLDRAVTAMGSRMIKKWLVRPLLNKEAIVQRQDAVDVVVKDPVFAEHCVKAVRVVGDLERVVGRLALRRAQIHDYLLLKQALGSFSRLKALFMGTTAQAFHFIGSKLVIPQSEKYGLLYDLLNNSLNDDTSHSWIIKSGFDEKLDRLRELSENSTAKVVALEQRERKATGIQSLKVRYNQVHGYHIEVTKPNLHLVPDHYVRQQTLAGRERFTTPELKALQGEIMNAKSHVNAVENDIFERIKQEVYAHIHVLRQAAHALAFGDALLGFGRCAYEHGYVRPSFNDNGDIIIKDGQHPVVSSKLENRFIPNDTNLTDQESFWIITGPNMGGKSTYLRQVALISLMAQCGSFVSAQSASLPLLDRIFTRIGASDNVAEGKSTFLVEMEETALICSQATSKSLVILDEVGRGTSTFDGLAIAQAVVEYLYMNIKARCLFATHYHELTSLQEVLPGLISYYAASRQTESGIVFLYKIIKGVADGSFGLEVAKLVHIPDSVIDRARVLVEKMQKNGMPRHGHGNQNQVKELEALVYSLQQKIGDYEKRTAILDDIDYDHLSPKQAFDMLWKLHENNDTKG